MKNLLSNKLLSSVASSLNESVQLKNQAEKKRERKKFSYETSVFLSHKHDEKDIIQQAIVLLNKLGVDVYVDWLDSGIPANTNEYTATRIKEKIRENEKFILLATEQAIRSRWCNWELGYGDAFKYGENIAIMPITEKEDNIFSGSEYLKIYPIITSEYTFVPGTYYVEHKGSRIPLQKWLQK